MTGKSNIVCCLDAPIRKETRIAGTGTQSSVKNIGKTVFHVGHGPPGPCILPTELEQELRVVRQGVVVGTKDGTGLRPTDLGCGVQVKFWCIASVDGQCRVEVQGCQCPPADGSPLKGPVTGAIRSGKCMQNHGGPKVQIDAYIFHRLIDGFGGNDAADGRTIRQQVVIPRPPSCPSLPKGGCYLQEGGLTSGPIIFGFLKVGFLGNLIEGK